MKGFLPALLGLYIFLGGCGSGVDLPWAEHPVTDLPAHKLPPLPVQQMRAYDHTQTGLFVSLADFETGPEGQPGKDQLRQFSFAPDSAGQECRFDLNITRTGSGGAAITLAPGSELIFRLPEINDLRAYTLLSMAIYSEAARDDLSVTLVSDSGQWKSTRQLIGPGWSNVLIDLHRLVDQPKFDLSKVRQVRISLLDSQAPTGLNLDDVLLIDNRRQISPTPSGLRLSRVGLNWRIEFDSSRPPIILGQSSDGLWRLGADQALMRLAGPDGALGEGPENLVGMGWRRYGQVQLLEHNEVRLRLASTWNFPVNWGDWPGGGSPRSITWEYTFYGDGRCVTQVQFNNAGGERIGSAGIWLDSNAAWADAGILRHQIVRRISSSVFGWRYMLANSGNAGSLQQLNYLNPGQVVESEAEMIPVSSATTGGANFDPSEGCYRLKGISNRRRFTIYPPPEGLLNPVFRVEGNWSGYVHVNSLGQTVRDCVTLPDGSVLFILNGMISQPTVVEMTGQGGYLAAGQL